MAANAFPFDDAHYSAGGVGRTEFELQRSNNFVLEVDGEPGLNDVIRVSLVSFGAPKDTTGKVEHRVGNEVRNYAGETTFDDLTLVLKDSCDVNTVAMLRAWRDKVHDPVTGRRGLAKEYKKDGVVKVFSPAGTMERQYRVMGIWPMTFNSGDYSKDTVDAVHVDMTFACDKGFLLTTDKLAYQ